MWWRKRIRIVSRPPRTIPTSIRLMPSESISMHSTSRQSTTKFRVRPQYSNFSLMLNMFCNEILSAIVKITGRDFVIFRRRSLLIASTGSASVDSRAGNGTGGFGDLRKRNHIVRTNRLSVTRR